MSIFSIDTEDLNLFDIDGILAMRIATEAATSQVANMQLRVSMGKGIKDSPMKKYSKAYAKKREAANKNTNKRDLVWTGQMMRSISMQEVQIQVFEEGFGAVATIAPGGAFNRDKIAWNNVNSPFYGISPNDAAVLDAVAEITIDEYLREQEEQ
jgi:hypothetical protein